MFYSNKERNMLKRISNLIIALIIIASMLVGCGQSSTNVSNNEATTQVSIENEISSKLDAGLVHLYENSGKDAMISEIAKFDVNGKLWIKSTSMEIFEQSKMIENTTIIIYEKVDKYTKYWKEVDTNINNNQVLSTECFQNENGNSVSIAFQEFNSLEIIFDNMTDSYKSLLDDKDEENKNLTNTTIVDERRIDLGETIRTYSHPILQKEVINDEETIGNINLTNQIANAKIVSEYSKETMVEQMDTVTFGSYPQSDASGNTKEPIEWIVLEKSGRSALLLSKYIIDCKCYKDRKGNMLKKWLNSTFYNDAFNNEEQNLILTDRDTNTDVFCLSVSDIEEYFNLGSSKNSFQHECLSTYGTNFAKTVDYNGDKLKVSDGKNGNQKYVGCSPWWTQSKGSATSRIITVGSSGAYLYDGSNIYNVEGVRPAIWVALK